MTNPKEQLVCGGNVFQLVLIIIFNYHYTWLIMIVN